MCAVRTGQPRPGRPMSHRAWWPAPARLWLGPARAGNTCSKLSQHLLALHCPSPLPVFSLTQSRMMCSVTWLCIVLRCRRMEGSCKALTVLVCLFIWLVGSSHLSCYAWRWHEFGAVVMETSLLVVVFLLFFFFVFSFPSDRSQFFNRVEI